MGGGREETEYDQDILYKIIWINKVFLKNMLGWRLSTLAHNWADMTSKRQWGRDSLLKWTSSILSNIQPHSGNTGDFLCVYVYLNQTGGLMALIPGRDYAKNSSRH